MSTAIVKGSKVAHVELGSGSVLWRTIGTGNDVAEVFFSNPPVLAFVYVASLQPATESV